MKCSDQLTINSKYKTFLTPGSRHDVSFTEVNCSFLKFETKSQYTTIKKEGYSIETTTFEKGKRYEISVTANCTPLEGETFIHTVVSIFKTYADTSKYTIKIA